MARKIHKPKFGCFYFSLFRVKISHKGGGSVAPKPHAPKFPLLVEGLVNGEGGKPGVYRRKTSIEPTI
jgi:hypothetical protein